jgi:hypothetical protein
LAGVDRPVKAEAKKMRREVILGLTLIGFSTIAAHVASLRVAILEPEVSASAQAPVVPRPLPQATTPFDQPAVVVTVVQRTSAQSGGVRTEGFQSHLFGDGVSLAKTLQSELQRVGCYDREINGIWTTSSRMAMQTFLEEVNAALPFDEPNVILLSLVQAHNGAACRKRCPVDQTRRESCPSERFVAAKFKQQDDTPATLKPLVTGSLVTNTPQPLPQSAPASVRAPAKVGTSPADPPKLVRKILRSLQRGMAQLGLH